MVSSALGSIGFAFEPTAAPGEQVDTPPGGASDVSILSYGAVAATASATNQPTGSGGMRCHIYVYSNTATGTVTITGKDLAGNAATETTPTIPIAPVNPQSQETGRFDYVTTKVFSSINASGITTSGLTGGFIKIGGIYAAKYEIPGTVKITPKYGEYSPDEHRGLGDRNFAKIQTIKDVDVELDMAMYPDTGLVIPYAIANSVNNPSTLVTNPGSPVTIKATTAVSGAPFSATTQPTAPGQKIIVVITGSSAVGTVGLAGLDVFGNAISETINCPTNQSAANGNGTYYSSNVYSAINASGITVTGLTSGSLAATTVFGWNRVWYPSVTPFTLALENFVGSESLCVPFTAFSECEFDFDVSKEFTLKAKAIGQDRLPIGNRSATPLTTSNVVAVAQPTDRPLASCACQVFIDPISGTPGTTQYGSLLNGKIKISSPVEGVHTLVNKQVYTQIARGKWEITFEGKAIYTDVLQLEQFRQDNKQYLQLNFYGKNVGSNSIQTVTFVIPFKFNKFEVTSTPSMKYPEADIAGIGEYDPGIGSSYKISWNNSFQPANYTA
jgi:hypothetical protein